MNMSSYLKLALVVCLLSFSGCARNIQMSAQEDVNMATAPFQPVDKGNATSSKQVDNSRADSPEEGHGTQHVIPGVSWSPSYKVRDVALKGSSTGLPSLKVGADMVSQGGPIPLKDVLKKLLELKGFSLSYASDVDKEAPVEVNIKAGDDFWESLENILRQQDYFFIIKKNTIVIGYKDTRRFYIPAPFLTGSYKTNVGGDLLGGQEGTQGMVRGTVSLEHSSPDLDIWQTISRNLDKILNLATTRAPLHTSAEVNRQKEREIRDACRHRFPSRPAQQALCVEKALAAQGISRVSPPQPQAGDQRAATSLRSHEGFFYTIDRPLGIITVTAPRSILEQVEKYIETLKYELVKQVVIEAKIIEVSLKDTHSLGVDWSALLKDSRFNFNVVFGQNGAIYPADGVKFVSTVTMANKNFDLLLDAFSEYGQVRVLSNPKLTLLNGHPAMLTVGESIRYIDSVESTVDSVTGVITYTVDTKSILSGLGFSVIAQITGDREVILQLTPVTSQLQEPIEYRSFGSQASASEVGLPRVNVREMTTMARVRDGEFLIIGGLIDEIKGTEETRVPVMGDIPFVGNAFKNTRRYTIKRELIILLRPHIVKQPALNS